MISAVLITGVSSGIGLGLAEEFLRRGANVYGLSRRSPEQLVSERFHFASVDLTDHPRVAPLVGHLLAGVRRLEVAVLAAGVIGEIGDMRETPLERIKQVMGINTWANKTVLDALLALPIDLQQVVTISSGASVNGHRGWSGYAISKAALNMLTQLYARENPHIHFAALAPGLVDTAMQDYLCSRPIDPRFPSLDQLRARRQTPEMPTPQQLAPRLVDLLPQLSQMVESGQYVDVRNLPEPLRADGSPPG